MRTLGSVTFLLLALLFLNASAQEPAPEPARHLQVDGEHQKWIVQVLRSISKFKPGMTRKDLSTILEQDGGLSFRSQARYVYKRCPYIKVDVEFSPADATDDNSQAGYYESPADKIVKISQPYLDYPIYD